MKLDTGLSALAIEAMKSSGRSEQEIETGRQVAAAVSKELVKKLQNMGLPAVRAEGDGPTSSDLNTVVISGHFVSIDEGNRTERVVIGLGLGRSDVRADIQIRQNGQMLETLVGDAKSGRGAGVRSELFVDELEPSDDLLHPSEPPRALDRGRCIACGPERRLQVPVSRLE